jgi:predicted hotdog family 3-hydroxylacyl-ACP dehydratase
MLLLDDIVHLEDDWVVARLTVRRDGLFDSAGEVPAYVGLEYMAQAMSALNGYRLLQRGRTVRFGFLAGTRLFRSHVASFRCGDVLHVSARRQLQTEEGLGAFDCRVESRNGATVVLCEAQVNAYSPDDPDRYYAEARLAMGTSS